MVKLVMHKVNAPFLLLLFLMLVRKPTCPVRAGRPLASHTSVGQADKKRKRFPPPQLSAGDIFIGFIN